ncbi:hypothetical protein PVAP13_9KG151485 [Panicum virgatum]|nr:hypothetical protein PVAP13_9KG151485 [Panicum virgatum]
MRFRLATWSVVAMSLIAALVPFAAVLIFLHHKKKGRDAGGPSRRPCRRRSDCDGSRGHQGQGGAGPRERQPEHGLRQGSRAAVLPRRQGQVRRRRAVPVHGGDAWQGPAGDHVPGDPRGRPRRRREAAAQHGARAAQGLRPHHAAPGQAPARERRRPRRGLLLQGGEAGRVRARPRLQPLPAPAREQGRGEDAAAMAGEAGDRAGRGARAGVPAPVAAVLPPAAARQPQVVQRARLLLGARRQGQAAAAAEAGGGEADGPRVPSAAAAPRAPAGGGQVPGVRARRRPAAVVPRRRVLPRGGAAGAGDREGAGGGGRRPGGVGAAGAQPRVVHGHSRRGDRDRPGPPRGHAAAHGGRAALRRARARQAAQGAGRRQDDRRDRRRRRAGACRTLSSTAVAGRGLIENARSSS